MARVAYHRPDDVRTCPDIAPAADDGGRFAELHGYILPLSNLEAGLCREMFESPSPERKEEMLRHCAAHDLLGDRWYAGIKRELERRGIIASARLV